MREVDSPPRGARLINLPNALTLFRLLLILTFLWLYFSEPERPWIALTVYLGAAITDYVDGYLARRWNQVTWFGKLFDPLADKVLAMAMLYCLASSGRIGWWVLGVFLAKELYMIAGSGFLLSRNYVVKADYFGKTATAAFIVASALTLPWHGSRALSNVGRVLLYISLGMSLLAMVHYTVSAVKKQNEFKSN